MRSFFAFLSLALLSLVACEAVADCDASDGGVQASPAPGAPELEVAIDAPPERAAQRVVEHHGSSHGAPEAGPLRSSRPAYAEDWDDRDDLVWEAGTGFWLGLTANEGARASASPGVVGLFGLHTMVNWRRERHEKWSMPEVEATRWCAPIACLGLGLIVAPTGVVLGNEIGADLRGVYGAETRSGEGSLARISLRPVFHYARGTLRTQSFVGFLVPELGLELREGREPAFAMAWSIYPIDWRVHGPMALSLDPLRVGALVTPERGSSLDVGGELTLRFAP